MKRKMRGTSSRRKPPAPTTMTIPSGAEIKKMREDRWISVLELAKKSKVTRQAIAAWESGKRIPRFETARKVWEALKKIEPIQTSNPTPTPAKSEEPKE